MTIQKETCSGNACRNARVVAALLTTIAAMASLTGCHEKPGISGTSSTGAGSPPAELWKEFSGDKAFALTKAQCDIGPRIAASPELEKTRVLIESELKRDGWTSTRQTFTDSTPKGYTKFSNIVARFGGSDKTQRFIVCSHYDTKMFDTIRFVGASDGASSTGALLELARVLAMDPALAARVELVFFDGEEAFVQFTEDDGLYGSRYYGRDLRITGRNEQFKAGILWDMIGDKNLTVTFSPDSPAQLLQQVIAAADELQDRKYFTMFDRPIWDDHVPLNLSHIPTLDIIDFNYPPWHTADDTIDKLSPNSLQVIGAVTLRWLKTANDAAGK